ncbi:MAG: HD-GYP domain-containing protein [Treponema sp.]|jgi:HD-GYP domain-containing protein (c-di-GMP phosphodiesterase class II)|nr:HD-GYP domain-containing protein [Treponema sp.]
MNSYNIKDIPSNGYFSKAVYLDEAFIITAPEMPFSSEIALLLDKWKYHEVISEGEPTKEYTGSNEVDSTAITASEDTYVISSQNSDLDKLEKARKFYTGLIIYLERMFDRITRADEFDYKEVIDKIKDMVDYIKEDRRFLMRIIKSIEPGIDKNYLAIHSVRSTILSIIIGTYLKLPNHRLIELGAAALLHEVGMLKLPATVYLSNRALTPTEQKAILTHPILGYNILKSFNFPLTVCLAALEHHERENGSGYPQRLSSEKISLNSKIIAVACSYEALSTKRPFKDAKDGYTGMLELLKNEGKQYDDTIVKALVYSLSIYPIGLYVLLSNNKKGQVVDINPETPRFPIVQIFGEVTPDGKIKTMQTSANGLSIVRPLQRSEIEN